MLLDKRMFLNIKIILNDMNLIKHIPMNTTDNRADDKNVMAMTDIRKDMIDKRARCLRVDCLRRYIAFVIMMFSFAAAWAVPPNLASEKIFDRQDLRRPGIKLAITKMPDNYYRGIIVDNDKELMKEVKNAVEKDRDRAYNMVENYSEDGGHIVLNILNNDHVINIGFSWKSSGAFRFFIQSELSAFE